MKKTFLVLSAVTLLAWIIRTIFLPQHALTFGYDQARDAVHSLSIVKGDLKILGPSSSTPGLYHGVLYYYVLAPAYLLGKGSPVIAAVWIAFLNALTCFTVFSITYLFTKKKTPSFLSAVFFAFSFESTQYATWLSNPTLGVLTVPLIYLGLWGWISKHKLKVNLWPLLTGVSLGFSIQSEIFLAYHLAPLTLWLWVYRKKISKHELLQFVVALGLSLSTMILSEVKFGFKGVSGFLSLLSSGDAIVASKGLGDFVTLFLNQLGRVYSFNSYPGNVGYGFGIVVISLIFIWSLQKNEKIQIKWAYFLATWLFSHITVVTLGGTSTPFLLVGIGPAVSILLGIVAFNIYKANKSVAVAFILIILASNLKMIIKENPRGSTIFAIQKDMTLAKEMSVIDYTYKEANNNPFSINTLTSPLWVNIVWSYLYKWYGVNQYGYTPTFHGHGQEGQVTALESSALPKAKSFLIIEPMAGIPMQYLPLTIGEEDSKSRKVSEKNFGDILVQTRLLN